MRALWPAAGWLRVVEFVQIRPHCAKLDQHGRVVWPRGEARMKVVCGIAQPALGNWTTLNRRSTSA
jgi:hypothetical protein